MYMNMYLHLCILIPTKQLLQFHRTSKNDDNYDNNDDDNDKIIFVL